jgi:hypothetical protein
MVSRRAASGVVVLWVVLAALSTASSGRAQPAGQVFYLAVRPHKCLIASSNPRAKSFWLVQCSNPTHNLEVFAVEHGGWGKRTVSLGTAASRARAVCLTRYRKLTGHGTPLKAGWAFFFADPGAESRRYGDRVVCGYRAWPELAPLGSGWHVR